MWPTLRFTQITILLIGMLTRTALSVSHYDHIYMENNCNANYKLSGLGYSLVHLTEPGRPYSSTDCWCTISSSPSMQTFVTVQWLDMRPCAEDVLYIYDGYDTFLGQVCESNDTDSLRFQITSGMVRLKFASFSQEPTKKTGFELTVNSLCLPGPCSQDGDEFHCHSGGYIAKILYCDNIQNCPDGSDELDCSDLLLEPRAFTTDATMTTITYTAAASSGSSSSSSTSAILYTLATIFGVVAVALLSVATIWYCCCKKRSSQPIRGTNNSMSTVTTIPHHSAQVQSGYPTNTTMPQQGYPNQPMPQSGYPNQPMPQSGYPNQPVPQNSHHGGYPNQVMPPQSVYPSGGYTNPGFDGTSEVNPQAGGMQQDYPTKPLPQVATHPAEASAPPPPTYDEAMTPNRL